MIALLILNNSGDVIYQSTFSTRQQPNEANIIRLFLPLLLTKDLLKANFHDRIHYVHHRNKTIAFWEKHGLLYLMWTRRGTIPANMLQHHLHIIDRLLHFQFGPHWYTKVEGLTTSSTRPLRWRESLSISHTDIATCLSRLPFLMVAAPLLPRLYSPEMLCSVEQIELQEDLRQRLEECLRESCDTAFGSGASHQNTTSSRFVSFFATPPSSRRVLNLSPLMRHYQHTESHHHYRWTNALLFARDKLVARCSRANNDTLLESALPSEALLFLKTMAFEYAEQAAAREDIAEQRMSRPSASSSRSHDTMETSYDNDDNGPTPQPSSSEATSQKSSVTYIYDSSSVSAPFKIREKSTSSVTVASSNCSTPSLSWSSPPILMHNQLLSRLSRKSLDADDRPLPELRRWSSLTRHTTTVSASQAPPPLPSSTTDLLPSDQLPPNATIFHHPSTGSLDEKPIDGPLPPSSLPLESGFDFTNRPTLRQSAPSSPASRSRSQSNADRLSARTSLKNMFSTFLQGDQHQQPYDDDTITPQHEGKVMSRWIKWKHQHHMTLCVILLVHLGEGLCATIIFRDEEQERQNNTTHHHHHHHHQHLDDILPDRMTNHTAVKTLRTTLQDHLKDFSSFILTKETTHFSILSFITNYPGLLHFIHIRNGSMLSPRIVDLTYLNQDHDLILEMGEKYQEWVSCSETAPRWGWPSITRLEQLSEEMVKIAKACSANTTAEYHVNQLPGHPGFQCAFRHAKNDSDECLMAMYFSFIPEAVVLDMHHRLFHDVGQRLLDQ